MKKTIFLDFDGVLHYKYQKFYHVKILSNVILPFKNTTNIVISSSWRMTHSLDELKKFFPDEIKNLIIGITPIFYNSFDKGIRQKEIEYYIKNNNLQSWLIIDDEKYYFSDNISNILWTNSFLGLSEQDMIYIKNFLEK